MDGNPINTFILFFRTLKKNRVCIYTLTKQKPYYIIDTGFKFIQLFCFFSKNNFENIH